MFDLSSCVFSKFGHFRSLHDGSLSCINECLAIDSGESIYSQGGNKLPISMLCHKCGATISIVFREFLMIRRFMLFVLSFEITMKALL